jgi:predicted RecA/RadA family phage recombinase
MKNFVQDGDVLDGLTAPYAVSSGGGVKLGTNIFGIAVKDAANAATDLTIKTTGVFDVTALATDTGTPGTVWYWDDTNKRLTTTASTHIKIGVGVGTKINGDTTARVRLNGVFG